VQCSREAGRGHCRFVGEGAAPDRVAPELVAGVLKVLDAFEKLPSTTGGVLATATKHEDHILVSHHYNWKPGTYKDAYTHGAYYRLKQTAPEDATDALATNAFEPLLEKLLADGTIVEYEVDEEAIHTEDPQRPLALFRGP
jgi:hypothetical protein